MTVPEPTHCPHCNGEREVYVGPEPTLCYPCDGTGRAPSQYWLEEP